MNLPTSAEPARLWVRPIVGYVRAFFLPPQLASLAPPPGVEPSLVQACEQVLTTLLRSGSVVGVIALLLVIPQLLAQGRALQVPFVCTTIIAIVLLGLIRTISYQLRASAYLLCLYGLALADLIALGSSAEVYAYLIGFAFFAAIYFCYRPWVGLYALGLSLATLALFGVLIRTGAFVPLYGVHDDMSLQLQLIRALVFLLVVGTGQVGINALLGALRISWRRERDARERLEERVAERTRELAVAHERALEQSRLQSRQQEYLAALHQTTIDLLSQREVDALLRAIVERAATIMRVPHVVLLLEDQGELVVRTFTPGLHMFVGERISSDAAQITWRAFTSRQPVIVSDYLALETRIRAYDALGFRSLADIPILAGSRCLGVLALTRTQLDQPFTAGEVEQALAFARLIALVIDSARLYDAAQLELAERRRIEAELLHHTNQLTEAHAQAIAHSKREAEQHQYLAALHQTFVDLLSNREITKLLELIVARAASILDARYSLVVLERGGELITMALTPGLPTPTGSRAERGVAIFTWQCYETRQPVIVDNYLDHARRNLAFDALKLESIAHIPILAEQRCLGVLILSRDKPGHHFTQPEIERASTFAQLAAVVIDNARLYDAALREADERKCAEQKLQRYADALEQQNAELDAFAHTVAHDLKSPLTSIIGYAELLVTNVDLFEQQDVTKFHTTIMQMGYKMTRIVNDLLLLASVRAGEQVPREPLDLEQIMLDLDIRLAQAVASSGATIARPQCWPAALGYAPWVEEVLANYLTNAIKYGGQPPVIRLGAEPTDDCQVRFWVEDNGPGLSADEQAQLFTPFTRLRARRAEGHGLGLSIVQRIVQRLGGSVGVESQPGQGSRFFFTLPAAPDLPASAD